MSSNLVSVARAAKQLGLSTQAVYLAIKRRRLVPIRMPVTPDLTVQLIPSDQIADYRATSLHRPGRKRRSETR